MTQAAAEPGDSSSRAISAEWPLCQPAPHKRRRAGDTAGLSPVPSRLAPSFCLHHVTPASCPQSCCVRLEHEVTAGCHHRRASGAHHRGGSGFQPPAHSRPVGRRKQARGSWRQAGEKHSGKTELFVPRVWDRKVAAGSQPGVTCGPAPLQHPRTLGLPSPARTRHPQGLSPGSG